MPIARRSRPDRRFPTAAAVLLLPAFLAAGVPTAGAAGSNPLTVTAGEYTYKLSGSPKAGWTEITFDNAGVEYHMMAIGPLKKGVTTKQLKTAAVSEDDAAFEKIAGKGEVFSYPNFLSPGEKTTVVTKLSAGRYGLLCFIPAPDGESHVAHGMVKVFDVSSDKSSLTPPKDGVVDVTMSDEGVTLPASGLPAHGWAKITNATSVPRSVTVARYTSPGVTFEQADAYFDAFFEGTATGDAPASLAAGVASIPPNGTAYLELDMEKGNHAFVSSNDELDDDANELHVDFTVQ